MMTELDLKITIMHKLHGVLNMQNDPKDNSNDVERLMKVIF